MKRIFLIITTILLLIAAVGSAEGDTTISFAEDNYTVAVGKEFTLKATVTPKGKMNLEWSSSNETVATVSKKGQVKGISAGEAEITACSANNPEIKAICKIKVIIPVKKITILEKTLPLAPGVYHQLNATVEPEDATISALSWSTSNEKVAVVDDTGKVTGIGKGNAKITATATDGCGAKASVTIKIDEYHLVFTSKKPQKFQYWYSGGSGNYKIRGHVKNGNVSIPNIDTDLWTSRTGGQTTESLEVTPLHPGTDVVTVKINNLKINCKVFIADYFEENEMQYEALPDTSPNASNGSFRDIIYGTPYSKLKNDLPEIYGNNYEISDYGTGMSVTFKNPGINVAGHDVLSLELNFCYDLDQNGAIAKDESLTSFFQAEYLFDKEENDEIALDLYNKLNELYGQTYFKFEDASFFDWLNNNTSISLSNSTDVNLLYTWSPGRSKTAKLREMLDYLKEIEEQKKKETKESEYGSSIDGL